MEGHSRSRWVKGSAGGRLVIVRTNIIRLKRSIPDYLTQSFIGKQIPPRVLVAYKDCKNILTLSVINNNSKGLNKLAVLARTVLFVVFVNSITFLMGYLVALSVSASHRTLFYHVYLVLYCATAPPSFIPHPDSLNLRRFHKKHPDDGFQKKQEYEGFNIN